MPRRFTTTELNTLTVAQVAALYPTDALAYHRQILELDAEREARFLNGDYDRIGSYRRFELGE